jgi:AAA+ ATPase superfamily predicted ATPase
MLPWAGRPVRFPLSLLASIGGLAVLIFGVFALLMYYTRKDRQRRKRALRRGFNPYISGEPIRREDMFFGRGRFIEEILRILHNNSIMIHGERRIGKTTLLYQLSNILSSGSDPDYQFIPVLADLEGTTKDTFFHVVMDDVVRTCAPLLKKMPDLAFDPRNVEDYGDRDFSRDLSSILSSLKFSSHKEVKLILLMDEMDVVDTFGTMVQLQLRRIFMTTFAENLGAVVAGVKISRRWDRPESPWYNLFHEMRVPMFTDTEARELITEPVRGVYRYSDRAIDRIIIHGKGRPYRIQRYCLESVNHMLSRDDTRIVLDDVESAHGVIRREWARYLRSARTVG